MKSPIALLALITVLALIAVFSLPSILQDLSYHLFSDNKVLFAIPHAFDVLSNVAFVVVGIIGLISLLPRTYRQLSVSYWLGISFWLSIVSVAFGSAWYHLDPNNDTLVWDRLPMALGFMSLFLMIFRDSTGLKWVDIAAIPMQILALMTVVYWAWTEQSGVGDLRPYVIVQYLPILLIPLLLWFYPNRKWPARQMFMVLACYGVAKVLEALDVQIYIWSSAWVSGHTLKHLAAALACALLIPVIRQRSDSRVH